MAKIDKYAILRTNRQGIRLCIVAVMSLACREARSESSKPAAPPVESTPGKQPNPQAQKPPTQVSGSAALFDLVTELTYTPVLKPEEVAAATGLQLVPDKGESSQHFAAFRSKPRAAGEAPGATGVQGAKLLTPRKSGSHHGSLLTLEVASALGIGQAEVKARFGDKPELSVPTPDQPASAPIVLIYQQSWGALRFRFERGKAQALVSIVIDGLNYE